MRATTLHFHRDSDADKQLLMPCTVETTDVDSRLARLATLWGRGGFDAYVRKIRMVTRINFLGANATKKEHLAVL
jgi:hypothetical protein